MPMRNMWHLPSNQDLQVNSSRWFKLVLEAAPKHMIDYIILTSWRAWYARNEVTHSKPLSTIEGSKRFLTGYVKMLRNLKDASTDEIIKGKQPVLASTYLESCKPCPKEPPDKR
jgi:hypothetical protein